jgi:hypothetical protein
MTGFSAADQAMVKRELEKFLQDTATITRMTSTKVKGDYVKGAPTTVATDVPARVQPITPLGTEKTRLKGFPMSIVEKAEYLLTLSTDVEVNAQDQAEIDGITYNMIAVRFDNATWRPVYRAVAVRVEL